MVIIGRVTPPNVGIVFSANNVQLKIGQKTIGPGNVYISQNSLIWQPTSNIDGISIFWKQISVHGISTEPSKCIYFMLDHQLKWPGIYDGEDFESNGTLDSNGDGGNESDEQDIDEIFEDAEEDQITECWLIPEDQNSVSTMYQAMTECQSLHPDSGDSISGDSEYMDGDNDIGVENPLTSDDNANAAVEEARDTMNNMSLTNNRFDDADE